MTPETPTLDSDATRRFGDAEVTIVDHGRLLSTPERLAPQIRDWPRLDRRQDGTVVVGMNGVVVRTADAVIVVDPGGPVETDRVEGRYEPGPGLGATLRALSLAASEVTHVMVTHGHIDHYLEFVDPGTRSVRFPKAEHLFPADDLPSAPGGGSMRAEEFSQYLEPIALAGRLTPVRGDVIVCTGVSLLAAPGESPGHQVVRVGSAAEAFYFLGDLVHYADEVDQIDWISYPEKCDPDLMRGSRERIFAHAGTSRATFVFAHARYPGWGAIERVGDGWRWRETAVSA